MTHTLPLCGKACNLLLNIQLIMIVHLKYKWIYSFLPSSSINTEYTASTEIPLPTVEAT